MCNACHVDTVHLGSADMSMPSLISMNKHTSTQEEASAPEMHLCLVSRRVTNNTALCSTEVGCSSGLGLQWLRRSIYSDLSSLPSVHDPEVARVLNVLVSHSWVEIERGVTSMVEKALRNSRYKLHSEGMGL